MSLRNRKGAGTAVASDARLVPVAAETVNPLESEGGAASIIDLTAGSEATVSVTLTRSVPFVDLHADYVELAEPIDAAIARVLERSDFVLGGAVEEFETAFAAYCEVDHAVGVDCGLSALELILRAYGIGPGDEVITAANSFIATAFAIDLCGARPVLVDIDPDSYNLDPSQVEAAITPATRAIMPVHLYGRPAEMDSITSIAREHDLWVFEDACQAHGARYRGRRTGGLGDAAAFSFYPSKNLGAFGDAGMVVTHDPAIAERIRMLRNLGTRSRYVHEIKGSNHRMDTLQAAILEAKLPHLDEANAARRAAASLYGALLTDLPLSLPAEAQDSEHSYHLYVIQVDDRDGLQRHLEGVGVATGIHYPTPIHLQPAFRDLGYSVGDFPVAEASACRILSLPMYPKIEARSIAYTAYGVRSFLTE
jgi:dTDP-4-amino-4,6-dideoxygalactose transaminase